MRTHRIHIPFNANTGDQVIIDNHKAHYLRNVIRLKPHNQLKVFNDNNQEFLANIIHINKKNITIELIEQISPIKSSRLNIRLIQGLSKGERMDYTVQKATELGITSIIPVISEFCEVKLNDKRSEKKQQHWQNIAISACEQSFRADIPIIDSPISLKNYCQHQRIGILLEPNETTRIGDIAKFNWKKFDVVVGPEGGWSEKDLKLLESTGLKGIQFGQRILRTETVAPAILAAIHSLWGDFI